jgi:enterochelin esterase-like enzyme
MKYIQVLILSVIMFLPVTVKGQQVCCGKAERIILTPSEINEPRNIDVWLPEGYDTTKKYAVIYMHDGQMLFDSSQGIQEVSCCSSA